MTLAIHSADPAHPDFVGEVEGIDLRQPRKSEAVAAIEAGMDRFAVLVFHDQWIDDTQQLAFGRNFETLERETGDIRSTLGPRRIVAFLIRRVRNGFKRLRGRARKAQKRRSNAEVTDIGNLDRNNQVYAWDDPNRLLSVVRNMVWHSDSSFKPTPAKYSLLHARVIPSSGGNTEYADMRAAYAALDDETKGMIQDLVEHSQMYSRGALGFTNINDKARAAWPPVPQRLVRRHPVTGRRSLFLSSHAGGIIGWPVPEARVLLRDLTKHATQREFVHVHKWQKYDLVMWETVSSCIGRADTTLTKRVSCTA
jgi:alpha-ketoglutarate-dependent 2,4-dichlorophenoxyacetate dioxygenase